MNSIDVLEERVTELENRIYGSSEKKPSIDDPLPENSIVDDLLHVNTLIYSALSGREKTNNLATRLPELNEMLDPNYEGMEIQNEAKLEFLLAMEAEIKEYVRSVERIEELNPSLTLDSIGDVPELTPKLNRLALSYVESHSQSEKLAKEVWALFTEYNDIITSVAKTLINLNAAVTAAEAAASPKDRSQ